MLSTLCVHRIPSWIGFQDSVMQLCPLVYGTRQSAKPCWDNAGATIQTKVRGFSFDLMYHGFQLLAHLPALADTSRQLTCRRRHLLHQIAANGFIFKVLQSILCGDFTCFEKGSLHAWSH